MSTLSLALAFLVAPQVSPVGLTKSPHALPEPVVVVRETGLAVEPGPLAGERRLLVPVREFGMHLDLNQDGDQADVVLHVHDLVTNTTTNLGLSGTILQVDGERALVLVYELAQGNTDLNGDGDTLDLVFFAVDLAEATVRNSGLAWSGNGSGGGPNPAGVLDGDWAALNVGENMQGQTDLNADGVLSEVGFVWNLAAPGAAINTQLAIKSPYLAVHHPYPLLVANEFYMGDLNGDGDTKDAVLHAYLGGTGTIVNTGLAVTAVTAIGDRSAFLVTEAGQQLDLNGDGDTNDTVAHLFDASTGLLDNLALAAKAPEIALGAPGTQRPKTFELGADALVFHVSEPDQGNTDLDGDGNTGSPNGERKDTVLFLHDFATGVTRNLGLSAWEFTEADGLVAFEATEIPPGQDLDGSGFAFEHVAHVHDIAAGTTWNLGLPTSTDHLAGVGGELGSPFQVHGSWVAFAALEEDPTSELAYNDRNGDGDTSDQVLILANAATHDILDLELSVGAISENATTATRRERLLFHDAWGGVLSFLVSEDAQGQADRTGDGDHADLVLHFFRPDTGTLVDSHVPAIAPLLESYGRWFPFLARESGDGIDRNGDGDTNDVVLRIAQVRL